MGVDGERRCGYGVSVCRWGWLLNVGEIAGAREGSEVRRSFCRVLR